jgi:hypothetical protein
MTASTINATLSAAIRLTDAKRLEVQYRLTNDTGMTLCVFDKLYRTKLSGERVLDDKMAYVIFEDQKRIHLTRSLVPIPPGLKVEYPEVPYATLLPPRQSIEGKVSVVVPVEEVRPYREPLEPGTGKERVFDEVYFSLGVLPKTADLKLRELPHVGEGVFSLSYADAIHQQKLMKSVMVRLRVAGLVGPRS